MVTASFHKFTLLPPEIQQQIWTLAAESTAGAHFFTYNDEDEESEITRRNGRIRRTTESEYGPYLALAVPADDRSFVRPTKQKNKDDSVLGTYRDKGGVSRNVIVRSDTDLIILCLTDLSKLSWHRVRDDCPSSVTHLAFVYDPSPSQSGEGPQPSERAKAACNNLAWLAAELCYWPKCVWFIDYSLRRRPDARGSVDELRDEFWCATGRFVQVWADDDEDWYTGPGDGVHKLVASMKQDRDARLNLEEDLEEDMEEDLGETGTYGPGGRFYIPLGPDHPFEIGMPHIRETLFGVLAFQPW